MIPIKDITLSPQRVGHALDGIGTHARSHRTSKSGIIQSENLLDGELAMSQPVRLRVKKFGNNSVGRSALRLPRLTGISASRAAATGSAALATPACSCLRAAKRHSSMGMPADDR